MRGVHSTLSVPIGARGEKLGSLNLYARRPSAFGDDSVTLLTTFANNASIVLVNARAFLDARELSENLGEAMRSRATIDQATGILMAPGGRTAEEAFQLLETQNCLICSPHSIATKTTGVVGQ